MRLRPITDTYGTLGEWSSRFETEPGKEEEGEQFMNRVFGAGFRALKKHLGVYWPTLRDEIFGYSVIVAYRPVTPARPEQEQGMIALRAAAPKRLAELVDRFNQLQKDAGELKALG